MSDISFAKPDPRDFLDIDSLLVEEEILLRDTVRGFVQKEILPNVSEWWDQARPLLKRPAAIASVVRAGDPFEVSSPDRGAVLPDVDRVIQSTADPLLHIEFHRNPAIPTKRALGARQLFAAHRHLIGRCR